MIAALEAFGEDAVVRVAQRKFEVRDVPHEGAPERKVPFVQFVQQFPIKTVTVRYALSAQNSGRETQAVRRSFNTRRLERAATGASTRPISLENISLTPLVLGKSV